MASYRKEKTILAASIITSVVLVLKFVPRNKVRPAILSFLFKQVITWLFGLLVVEKNLIKYPYRVFFKKTYKASFSFEFIAYPAFCILFNLYYPEKKNIWIKVTYYFIHTSILTGLEVLMVKYTKLIRYVKWKWYFSFITMWLSNYLSHIFYRWFFKIKKHPILPRKELDTP
ncbi:CBO0543 family protein [Paucisalibacillus globulus]|uniref:CBO0543 family protein n=1 Tax=Paucisalibacillus globulus TaxID=351095 RepID=UPI00041AD92F|nr:CBO0543 family protein [Paucisalibacillus globulus]